MGATSRASAVRRSLTALALVAAILARTPVALGQEGGSISDVAIKVVAYTDSDSDSKVKIESLAIRDGVTVVVTFASAKLVGPGLTTDVVVGDPTGGQTRARLEVGDPNVTATVAQGTAGTFQQGKPASGSVTGNATVEVELPKTNAAPDSFIWAAASTTGGDRYLTPIFRLGDLNSQNPTRLPSPWGWASTADPPKPTNVAGVPVIDTQSGGIDLSYVRKPPKDANGVEASRVVDAIRLRLGGKGSTPAVLEVDEQTSAARMRKSATDPWVDVDASATNPDKTTGTVPVQKGSDLTITPKALEAALGEKVPTDTWISVSRVMFLTDGSRVDFAGVSVAGDTPTPGQLPRFSPSTLDPKVVWLAIIAVVFALLLTVRSFWRWLRESNWWQLSSGAHRLRTFLRRRPRRAAPTDQHRHTHH